MVVVVISHDGSRHIFDDQKDDKNLVDDLVIAVTSGRGFSLNGPRGLVAYGPGTVARIGIKESKKKEEPK